MNTSARPSLFHIRFRKDSNEFVCDKPIAGTDVPGEHYAEFGGLACARREGHPPPCIAGLKEAAEADGVCWECREPIGKPHRKDCGRETGD